MGAPRWDADTCVHATSKYSIAIAPPEGSQAYKSGDRGQAYSFTRVFDSDTAQADYFEGTAAPLVRTGGWAWGAGGWLLPGLDSFLVGPADGRASAVQWCRKNFPGWQTEPAALHTLQQGLAALWRVGCRDVYF
jgi:hypothetical protein